MIGFQFNDGGRLAAGYKGETGDCVCRAIAIATGLPYQRVYDDLIQWGRTERPGSRRRAGRRSHPRTGVFGPTIRRYLASLGWRWVSTMGIGSGCRVHLRADELPPGRIIVQVSKHIVAVIDGVIHDVIDDNDRDGTRCVYGYWLPPAPEDRRLAA